ncbi:DMT family transporter [Kitasatospora sp. HPMI-4]|uniref:DMT family transporter n=1 Tax=Kitasatospora sp. HPMI-4 TaxID=3448443 RepID=UPI003F1B9BA1
MTSKYSRGVLLCVIAAASWGGMFPVMTGALKHIDPFTFTCLRYTIAGVAFLALLLTLEGKSALNLKGERVGLAWFLGTSGFAGFQFLVFLGQKLVGPDGALIASIMMVLQPLLGFLTNWVVRKVAPPRGAFVFIAMSLVGVLLVITNGHLGVLVQRPQAYGADGLIILGALCWVIYTMGGSFYPNWSPVKYTTVTTGLGLTSTYVITAALLAFGAVKMPTGHDVVTILPHLAYMSIAAGVIGVLFWNLGNKAIGPLNGVLFMDVVPITAFTISAFQGNRPGAMQLIGALISAIALVLNNMYLRRRQASLAGPAKPAAEAAKPVAEAAKPAAAAGAVAR